MWHEQVMDAFEKGDAEGHPGGESRIVPIFPELRPHLEQVFDEAEPGTEYFITRYRQANVNLRSQLLKIITKAGLTPWPKLFQNLRSTRETELAEKYPIQVVCEWIGNSPQVASKHYLQITPEHYEKATADSPIQRWDEDKAEALQNAQQYTRKPTGKVVYKKSESPVIPDEYEALLMCTDVHVPPRGVEPLYLD